MLKDILYFWDETKPLFSPLCGNVYLLNLDNEKITVEQCDTKQLYHFSFDGKLYSERNNKYALMLLFPSKFEQTWDNYIMNDSVLLYIESWDTIAILNAYNEKTTQVFIKDSFNDINTEMVFQKNCKLVTKEQFENCLVTSELKACECGISNVSFYTFTL